MNTMISVIIPVYNAEKYLGRCLNSIINQSYKNIEIIIVNDGSTDDSHEICKRYFETDERIKYYKIENQGVSAARNIGIKNASGKYINFVDADDMIDVDTYKKCIDIIENEDVDILKYAYVREYGKYKKTHMFECVSNEVINKNQYDELIYNNFFKVQDFISACNVIVKKSIMKDILFDENIKRAEDFIFMAQIVMSSNRLFLLNEPLYHYIANQESTTQRYGGSDRIIDILDNIFIANNIVLKMLPTSNAIQLDYKIKVESAIYEKISIIAGNEKYRDYKGSIERIENLESYIEYCKNIEHPNKRIDKSHYKYIKYKIRGFSKKMLKRILMQGE